MPARPSWRSSRWRALPPAWAGTFSAGHPEKKTPVQGTQNHPVVWTFRVLCSCENGILGMFHLTCFLVVVFILYFGDVSLGAETMECNHRDKYK